MHWSICSLIASLALGALARADGDEAKKKDPGTEPRAVPLTRPELKQMLEDMKDRQPRIPRPEGAPGQGGGRPAGGGFGGGGTFWGGRDADPLMSLDPTFKTELFWIVSRVNNCQYCIGHQEVKLAVAGRKEEEIAALDGDWTEFTPAQRAAFAFARKLSYEPHLLTDADIDGLRQFYQDLQILEMIASVAANNAINRSHEGRGNPQSRDLSGFAQRAAKPVDPAAILPTRTFLTPTPDRYKDAVSKVAPVELDAKGAPTHRTVSHRPPLEPRAEVEKALEACRKRTPRLPLADEARARSLLPEDWPAGPLPQWVRLLANFPKAGPSRILGGRAAEEKSDLSPLLRAQVSWIVARQDRAWYAAGEAQARLKAQGWSDDQVYRLDGDWADFTPAERALFTVAKKLAASPVVLTDSDVAEAVKLTSAQQVGQLINYTTNRASFNRITEAAGLQLEQ
jgi:alkylhydroperoxidase family enzyme